MPATKVCSATLASTPIWWSRASSSTRPSSARARTWMPIPGTSNTMRPWPKRPAWTSCSPPAPRPCTGPARPPGWKCPAWPTHLCGLTRPIHFGVCAPSFPNFFCSPLPTIAVFGQKDWQQAAILRRMTADLGFRVTVVARPIVRSGRLALSSRNVYLSPAERSQAVHIIRAWPWPNGLAGDGERDAGRILAAVREYFAATCPTGPSTIWMRGPRAADGQERLDGPVLFAAAIRFPAPADRQPAGRRRPG